MLSNAVVISWTPYRRVGTSYQSTIQYSHNGVKHTIVRKFGFFTYHLVKYIHGEQVFHEMITERIEQAKREIQNGR